MILFCIILSIILCLAGVRVLVLFSLDMEDIPFVAMIIISIIISFGFPYFSLYVTSIKEVAELRSYYYVNLKNILYISNKVNNLVNTDSQNSSVMANTKNSEQLIKDTTILRDYVREVNAYNKKLYLEESKRNSGFFIKLWYGWLYPIDKDIKKIEIKI